MRKRKTLPATALPEQGLGDITLPRDDLFEAEKSLRQLSGDITRFALEKYERYDNPVVADLDLNTDLLERVKEIVRDIGQTVVDWARITIGELSIIIEEVRAELGSRRLAML